MAVVLDSNIWISAFVFRGMPLELVEMGLDGSLDKARGAYGQELAHRFHVTGLFSRCMSADNYRGPTDPNGNIAIMKCYGIIARC